jgi:peptide/nickel transport system ATP-binding protein
VTEPLLEARHIVRSYREVVSGSLPVAGTLGVLGASGAGKSTLTRLLLGLEAPDRGEVRFHGIDLATATNRELRAVRRGMQAAFQDPRSSLNPGLRIESIVAEPLLAQGRIDRRRRRRLVADALLMVGVAADVIDRRPEQLSGGERQRVAIARALVSRPELVVLDEPVSALDGPVRGRVLGLLDDLRATLELAVVMVSHDVRSVAALVTRVMVMYAGRAVEEGPTAAVLDDPLHPYTQALLAAVPRPVAGAVATIEPTAPAATGCACRMWCPFADPGCGDQPELHDAGTGRRVACWAVRGARRCGTTE